MDTRLLRHYEQELAYLREMGAEFAEAYPKIAQRLGMDGLQVLDPYVERLLEGAAFLSARTQLELELQFPALTQHLLEIVYPHFLAPTPSLAVLRFEPDAAQGGLESGVTIPRGTTLRGPRTEGQQTSCTFTTAQDVTLWPLELKETSYIDGRGELVAAGLGQNPRARAAIRLRIGRVGEGAISDLPVEKLCLYLSGETGAAWRLHEALGNTAVGLSARSTDRRADWVEPLPGAAVVQRGFGEEEALLPCPGQSFDGYRLLQEFFALPQRFFFFDLAGLAPAFARAGEAQTIDLFILLSESLPPIARELKDDDPRKGGSFELYAAPVVNLFDKRCDRVQIRTADYEHHLVPERTAPMDFEVHSIKSVLGIARQGMRDTEFLPFYSADDFTPAGVQHGAYYAIRRRMHKRLDDEQDTDEGRRRAATKMKRVHSKPKRTDYLGGELYLQLVDRAQAPIGEGIEQLAVTALCTNRDLPLLIGTGEDAAFTLPGGGPVSKVRACAGPTAPQASLAKDATAWKLISHLSLNYLSIADGDRGSGAQALRELLGIYAPIGDRVLGKQLDGIQSVESRPIVRRLADGVLSTAVRGLEVRIGLDETAFEGTSTYLLGAVLERFLAKYTSLNSFTETVIHSPQRGEIARWSARSGTRRLL